MTIKSTQKLIKIGTSAGVTVPARDLKHTKAKIGDEVEVTFKFPDNAATSTETAQKLDSEYQAFKAQYNDTLKNLADR